MVGLVTHVSYDSIKPINLDQDVLLDWAMNRGNLLTGEPASSQISMQKVLDAISDHSNDRGDKRFFIVGKDLVGSVFGNPSQHSYTQVDSMQLLQLEQSLRGLEDEVDKAGGKMPDMVLLLGKKSLRPIFSNDGLTVYLPTGLLERTSPDQMTALVASHIERGLQSQSAPRGIPSEVRQEALAAIGDIKCGSVVRDGPNPNGYVDQSLSSIRGACRKTTVAQEK